MSKIEMPSIRFHGFDDAWEQRKLGELTVESTEYTTLSDTLPLLTSSRSGLMYQNEYRGNLTTNSKDTLFSVVPLGACTYRHMSDDDVFHLNVNTLEKGLVSREYPVFFTTADNDMDFIVQYINSSSSFRSFCSEQKKGGTRTRLYYKTLCEFSMSVPTIAEQRKISAVLLKLDHLITLHQRKLEKLTNVKKSMLEKMFPQNGSCYPAVRFKGFTDPWERRGFGDVFEEYSEKDHAGLPPLTIIQGSGTIRRDESERVLQYDKASLSSYKVVNEGDFIVHLRSFEGGLEKANSRGIISPAYHTFHGEGVDSRFYYAYFRSKKFIDTDLKPHVYGIRDGRSIDIEGMKTIEIPFTSYPEQKLIGDVIDDINNLITLHQRELKKLQSIKKSLLEKMFV